MDFLIGVIQAVAVFYAVAWVLKTVLILILKFLDSVSSYFKRFKEKASLRKAETTQSPPWPSSTFFSEPAGSKHFPGWRWKPFLDDEKPLLKMLPRIESEADSIVGFGKSSRTKPPGWPDGGHWAWPNQRHGLIVTSRVSPEDGSSRLAGLYPFFLEGLPATIHLSRVILWNSGVEAQIEGEWEEASVTFFDTAFVVSRGWYQAGKEYDFMLTGIAYDAGPAKNMKVPLTPLLPEEFVRSLQLPRVVTLMGSSIFTSVKDRDVDHYYFLGTVKAVKESEEILGQTGWVVRVTVMRFDQGDADLDILMTRRVWKADEPPMVGQDIQGHLWLQGRLWSLRE